MECNGDLSRHFRIKSCTSTQFVRSLYEVCTKFTKFGLRFTKFVRSLQSLDRFTKFGCILMKIQVDILARVL